jgi:hypothetical protein
VTNGPNHSTIDFSLEARDRASARREVVGRWLDEGPGTITDRNRYRYNVESLSDASRIYLTRPTRLNKGMDFVINCENYLHFKKGTDKPPRHLDVVAELVAIASAGGEAAIELRSCILRVWNCEDPGLVLSSVVHLQVDLRLERALKLLRWFFIEQDLTYWTESGRWMLRNAIEEHLGALE